MSAASEHVSTYLLCLHPGCKAADHCWGYVKQQAGIFTCIITEIPQDTENAPVYGLCWMEMMMKEPHIIDETMRQNVFITPDQVTILFLFNQDLKTHFSKVFLRCWCSVGMFVVLCYITTWSSSLRDSNFLVRIQLHWKVTSILLLCCQFWTWLHQKIHPFCSLNTWLYATLSL